MQFEEADTLPTGLSEHWLQQAGQGGCYASHRPVRSLVAPGSSRRLLHFSCVYQSMVATNGGCTSCGLVRAFLWRLQAAQLRDAGLTAYNHNLDTSPEYYNQITTTRKYEVGQRSNAVHGNGSGRCHL